MLKRRAVRVYIGTRACMYKCVHTCVLECSGKLRAGKIHPGLPGGEPWGAGGWVKGDPVMPVSPWMN